MYSYNQGNLFTTVNIKSYNMSKRKNIEYQKKCTV